MGRTGWGGDLGLSIVEGRLCARELWRVHHWLDRVLNRGTAGGVCPAATGSGRVGETVGRAGVDRLIRPARLGLCCGTADLLWVSSHR